MAAGLPIVASDVSACREVLQQGSAAALLPPEDLSAWSQQLGALMQDSEYRQVLAQQALAHAPGYDIAHTAQRWYRLLES